MKKLFLILFLLISLYSPKPVSAEPIFKKIINPDWFKLMNPTNTPVPTLEPTATPPPPTDTPIPEPTEIIWEEYIEEVTPTPTLKPTTKPILTPTPTPTSTAAPTNYWQLTTIALISAIVGAGLFSFLNKEKVGRGKKTPNKFNH